MTSPRRRRWSRRRTKEARDDGRDLGDLPVFCGVPTGTPEQRADAAEIIALVRDLLAQIDYTLPAPPQVEVHVIRDERHADGVTELDGHGPIDPGLATELSSGARTRVVWTGGAPVKQADPGYPPSARTRREVKARDRHCRFPGCTRPPTTTDLDHATAYKDRPSTSVEDCELLCRFHHRIKHQARWSPGPPRERRMPLDQFYRTGLRHLPTGQRAVATREHPVRPADAYVDVFVTYGGFGGVQLALADGVPMVVAWHPRGQEGTSAPRSRGAGVGVNLETQRPTHRRPPGRRPGNAGDTRYAQAAFRLRDEIRTAGREERAAHLLVELAEAPAGRVSGGRSTVEA